MDLKTLVEIVTLIPLEAQEIVIKGREATEVFFSMPKEWKPAEELEKHIRYAPNPSPHYKSNSRWRIK